MSNNLTTDSQHQAASAPAGRPFRRTWFLAGSVMWCLVFVAGAALILVRHKQQSASQEADKPPVLILSDKAASGQPGGANASSGNVGTPVLPPWNPKGIDDFVFTEWWPERPENSRAIRDRVIADFREADKFPKEVSKLLIALRCFDADPGD